MVAPYIWEIEYTDIHMYQARKIIHRSLMGATETSKPLAEATGGSSEV